MGENKQQVANVSERAGEGGGSKEVPPTVGRIVHYEALGSADGRFPVGECRAAIITAVHPDGGVSLCVLNPTGMYFNERVQQNPLKEKKGGMWHWAERV